MKQSKMTGAYIYQQMSQAIVDVKEIKNALDVLDKELGNGHPAFIIVKKQHTEMVEKLKKLENTEYLVPVESHVASNPFDF